MAKRRSKSLGESVRDNYASRGFKARETHVYKSFKTKHRLFDASTDPDKLGSMLAAHRGFSAALVISYIDRDGNRQYRTVSHKAKVKKAKSRYWRAEDYNAIPMLEEMEKSLHKYVPGRNVTAQTEIINVQLDLFASEKKWKALRKPKRKKPRKPKRKDSGKPRKKRIKRIAKRSRSIVKRGKR